MSIFKQFLVIVRPFQCLTAAFAVVAFATIAARDFSLTPMVIAGASAMALLVFASSAFHCAFQKHDKPFSRHVNDYLPKRRPWVLGPIAGLAFLTSIVITINYLSLGATIAIFIAGGLVADYTMSRTDEPRNLEVAIICTTPVLVGWLASGTALSGWTWFFMLIACMFYLLREEVKDSQEAGAAHERIKGKREANEDADWGGTTGVYLLVPTLGTAVFANSLFGSFPGWTILLIFVTFGIFATGLFVPYHNKNRDLYPQGVMTVFVWIYLLAWILATPGSASPMA